MKFQELEVVIIETVCHELGLTSKDVFHKSSGPHKNLLIFTCRQFIVYLLNYYLNYNKYEISKVVGREEQTVALWAVQFDQFMMRKQEYRTVFFRIEKLVRSIVVNIMDYNQIDEYDRPYNRKRKSLAGTDLPRMDRLLNRYWTNKERERKLEDVNRSYS